MNLVKSIMAVFLISVSLQSCVVAYAMAMRDKKTIVSEWKQADYKVRVESRLGGFGPRYEVCFIYKKDFIFYKKVVENYFSFRNITDGKLVIVEKGYRYALDFTKDTMDVFH